METYNVNNKEYFEGAEFRSIVEFINSIKSDREAALLKRNPGYVINHRNHFDNDLTHYMVSYSVPYYDILVETLLHKDGKGYLDINEFTFQNNCFSKTVFHRMMWPTDKRDAFLEFVVNDWRRNPAFAKLEETANRIFNESDSLFEYHKNFVYNDEYQLATVNDVRQMFDELVNMGLLASKNGDLYEVYSDIELADADTDMKTRWYSGVLTHLDKVHITAVYNTNTQPKLNSLTSKFSLIPSVTDDKFEGKWLVHKINRKTWFIPQYLLFYNDKAI